VTTQIAVRLTDDLVAFVDAVVAGGGASSRAAVVTRALAREQRRLAAEQDAATYAAAAAAEVHDDLDDLVAWTGAHPIDIDTV
jgi:Arc/MetJ-type ribon-helix-helix transcriptional regulator